MVEERPADRHREALADRVNRTVRRLLEHKESLEEPAHGMHRVRQAEVPQRIGDEQVAEFVIDVGRGHRMVGQEREPQHHRERGQQEHAPTRALRQAGDVGLDPGTEHQDRAGHHQGQQQFDEIGRAETDGVVQGLEGAE